MNIAIFSGTSYRWRSLYEIAIWESIGGKAFLSEAHFSHSHENRSGPNLGQKFNAPHSMGIDQQLLALASQSPWDLIRMGIAFDHV